MPRSETASGADRSSRTGIKRPRLLLTVLCAGLCVALIWAILRGPGTVELTPLDSPAAAGARAPRLSALPGGGALLSWVEPAADGHALKFAVRRQGRWVRTGEAARGEHWFVNWADLPAVVAIDANFWVAHWLVLRQGGKPYDYDIALAVSDDAGANWRAIGPPHRDRAAAEHGFVSVFADGDGAGVLWLDGRDYASPQDKAAHPEKSGRFALRYSRIGRDGSLAEEQVVDGHTCTCCQTAAASTSAGAIAAWRGRTDDEIRDNRYARLAQGVWRAPQALGGEGWQIAGCPVNGPSLAARDDAVLAAWYTAEGDRPRVRAAVSSDGGVTFGAPVEIDAARPLGRVGTAWLDGGRAVVLWLSAPDARNEARLMLRTLDRAGRPGPSSILVRLPAARASGVPQLAMDGGQLVLAWTGSEPEYGIVLAAMPAAPAGP